MMGLDRLDLPELVALWIGLSALVSVQALRQRSAGIALAFVAILGLLHLPGAVVHTLPWNPFGAWTATVHTGTAAGVLGMLGFALGYLGWGLQRHVATRSPSQGVTVPLTFGRSVFIVGLVGFLLMLTPVARIPSLPAFLLSGMYMLAVGLCLALWVRQGLSDRRGYWRVLAGVAVLPLITLLTMGFLGFGMTLALIVVCFAASTYRPRWQMLLVGVAIAYGGLAVTSAYMANRNDLRGIIWGGGSLDERLDAVSRTAAEIKPLDLRDETLLLSLDARFNQGYFVGKSVEYTAETGEYAGGETLWLAMTALVPRVLWPNKPYEGGSMGLVSRYTGLQLSESSSFGIGLVMELYINFRSWGVLLGFALFGVLIRVVDHRARALLDAGDICGFFRTFLPAIALLNVGGQIAETAVSVVAGWLIGVAITRMMRHRRAHPSISARPVLAG